MDRQPLISVITVCLNVGDVIEKTIQSVINQDYPFIEYVIIDGMSTDHTLSIIEKYKDKISCIIREPDRGIYDAMNKGMRTASGEYINFMNAGDTFFSKETIREVFKRASESAEIIYGDHIRSTNNNNFYIKSKSLDSLWVDPRFCHQSAFYKRELILEYPFSGKYIASDVEQAYDLYLNKSEFYNVEIPVSVFDYGASRDTIGKVSREIREIVLSRNYNFGNHMIFLFYNIRFTLIGVFQKNFPGLFNALYKLKAGLYSAFSRTKTVS